VLKCKYDIWMDGLEGNYTGLRGSCKLLRVCRIVISDVSFIDVCSCDWQRYKTTGKHLWSVCSLQMRSLPFAYVTAGQKTLKTEAIRSIDKLLPIYKIHWVTDQTSEIFFLPAVRISVWSSNRFIILRHILVYTTFSYQTPFLLSWFTFRIF
jgi:hypothetical protein